MQREHLNTNGISGGIAAMSRLTQWTRLIFVLLAGFGRLRRAERRNTEAEENENQASPLSQT